MYRKLGIVLLFTFLFVSVISDDSHSSEESGSDSHSSSEERGSVKSKHDKISLVNINGVLDTKHIPDMTAVKELVIKDCNLQVVATLSMPNLRKIKIEHSKFDITAAGDATDDFSKLEEIDLDHITLSIIDKSTFSKLPNLKELKIENTKIGHLKEDMFKGDVKLKEFECDRCEIESIEVGAFNDLQELEELDLKNNKLAKFDFGKLPLLPKLKEINLSYNPLTNIDLDKIKENCPKLRKIVLKGVHLESDIESELNKLGIDVKN